MFKFILLTLLIAGAVAAVDAEGYDETADIVEMAFEAADAFDDADNGVDSDLSEENNDNMGYMYNDGDLEDNINIAINAAILDKYGQAVTSERTEYKVDKAEKVPEPVAEQVVEQVAEQVVEQVAAKSDNVEQVEKPESFERSAKSVAFQQANNNKVVDKVDKPVYVSKAAKPLATAVKHPQYDDNDTITRFVSQVNADGTYGFDFAQSSGLEFKEVGQGGLYAQGSYQYVSPEGEHISVTYKADENGFHPESDSLPTPPPIPAYILKALQYIREHPTAEELADREVRAKQI